MSDASNLTTAIPTVSEPALERMIFLSDQSVLIGALITILLTGIGLSQAYYYFNEYSDDAWWSKALVVVVTSLGLLESICVCKVTYRTLITVAHDTDVTNIIKIDWSTPTVIAVHVILGGIVLLYFVYSCFRLLENRKFQKSIISVLLAIIVVHIGFGIASVVHTSTIQTVLQMNVDRKQEQIPWLTTQVAADVLVSATLCLSLPTPSYKQTRSVVHRIVVYAISRGILTSAAALVQLAQDFIDPQNMRTVAAEWIIPWVYTNSLLAALNSRKRLRRRLRADVNMTSDIPTQQPISVMDFYRPNMTNEDGSATAHQITPVPVEAKREALEMEVYTPAKTV